jgi:hypothetical protein
MFVQCRRCASADGPCARFLDAERARSSWTRRFKNPNSSLRWHGCRSSMTILSHGRAVRPFLEVDEYPIAHDRLARWHFGLVASRLCARSKFSLYALVPRCARVSRATIVLLRVARFFALQRFIASVLPTKHPWKVMMSYLISLIREADKARVFWRLKPRKAPGSVCQDYRCAGFRRRHHEWKSHNRYVPSTFSNRHWSVSESLSDDFRLFSFPRRYS